MSTIALVGAGGKMGCRIADNLRGSPDDLHYVEVSTQGIANLAERGLVPTAQDEAVAHADAVILAVPDHLIGRIAGGIAPHLPSGAMLILLDPAAAHVGDLPSRADITYFVVHPCHPPLFADNPNAAARRDYFGGVAAPQNLVCALAQGHDEAYEHGVALARRMFAPVLDAYPVSVEQMALLEPGLTETTMATCLTVIREAMDEVIRRGVPPDAARAFLLGHLNIELAIIFGAVSSPFSDGALIAIERAKGVLFQPDWKRVFEPANIRESVQVITRGGVNS